MDLHVLGFPPFLRMSNGDIRVEELYISDTIDDEVMEKIPYMLAFIK